MNWMDVLSRYRDTPQPPGTVNDDFDAIAREVPRHDLSEGLEEAFRSEQTPPFEQMVRQMFEHSDAEQRAGALNRFREVLGRAPITPDEAREVSPHQAEALAASARAASPNIMQRMAQFYADHPRLVQTLGQA